jgi:thiol:disulfide interchange protein DsbD
MTMMRTPFSPSVPVFARWRGLVAWLIASLCLLAAASAAAQTDFLEPEQAFALSVRPAGEKTVALHFEIAPGYYLYRKAFHFQADGATLSDAVLPPGKVKFDETFQENVETYRGQLDLEIPVQQAPAVFELRVVAQGCADAGLCYPPMTTPLKVSLLGWGGDGTVSGAPQQSAAQQSGAVPGSSSKLSAASAGNAASAGDAAPLPAATAPDGSSRIQRILQGGSWWTTVGAFWLMGLLLSFTPCVLPMLPILSSIIAGGGPVSRWRGLSLAWVYALGMSLVYTALGVAAGLAGEGLAAALQQPWVLLLFGLLLVVLALSMFDVYELQLPHALSTRLDGASRNLPGGRFVGVFLMGGLSALIVSPCVTGPLAGALVFLSQTRDVTLAGSALFALAWGMSVPLLLLGFSAGAWLPRSGAWMHAVKRFFGLLLIAVALWIVQPVLPPQVVLLAWGLVLLVVGFMLRPFDAHPHAGAPRVWLQRALGVAALAFGVMQLAGAASGGRDAWQPLAQWTAKQTGESPAGAPALAFRSVSSVAELDELLRTAARPVMLDFYADWCVSCKEMERFTFSDPVVAQKLSGALLLKADVTANSDEHKALLKRFGLFGPPGTIFFDPRGQELLQARVIGYQAAREFENSLAKAGL